MFIRKIKSTNGRTYIQVVDKSRGIYKVLKSFGSAIHDTEVLALCEVDKQWINKYSVYSGHPIPHIPDIEPPLFQGCLDLML